MLCDVYLHKFLQISYMMLFPCMEWRKFSTDESRQNAVNFLPNILNDAPSLAHVINTWRVFSEFKYSFIHYIHIA